jgi:hypothetical protein
MRMMWLMSDGWCDGVRCVIIVFFLPKVEIEMVDMAWEFVHT